MFEKAPINHNLLSIPQKELTYRPIPRAKALKKRIEAVPKSTVGLEEKSMVKTFFNFQGTESK